MFKNLVFSLRRVTYSERWPPVLDPSRTMAGHAKWQNIKHVKAERDRAKSLACNKYAQLARYAVREKGPDPKTNEKLAAIIEEARKHNVPMSTLEGAMKKKNSSSKTKFGFIEISGPGGSFIILDYETDNISTTRHDVKVVLKKYNSNIIQGEGKWRAVFSQKGIVKVVGIQGGSLDAEEALDVAIEIGAENVQLLTGESEKNYLEFHCDVNDLHRIRGTLEERCYEIEDAYVGFLPNIKVPLSLNDEVSVNNMLSDLGNIQEIVRIYENIEFSS